MVECHEGCTCKPLTVDTLVPQRRFATLNTAVSGAVSRAARCVLRVSNTSPPPADGVAPRSKVKLVSLAVLSAAVGKKNKRRRRGEAGAEFL